MSGAAQEEPRYGCPACLSVFRLGFSRCPIDGSVLQQLVEDPLVGTTIAERYLIEDCIGEGGMGRVYRARHQRVSRQFAIKVLFGDLSTDPKMRERFSREAEAASRLSHPNVISVMDFGETKEGLLYLAMDFVEGCELAQVIEEEGPFSSERVISIAEQLCLGLGHAHEEGLIHRDFKGENVILSRRGDLDVPRIVDFGIAVMLENAEARLTTQGLIIGTPVCMSPEQATGGELDARSDLFSLGVLMFEMLAGVRPFTGDAMAIARQNLASELPAINKRVPGLQVDQRLEAITRKLMAKLPEDRFQSATEVHEALARCHASSSVMVVPDTELFVAEPPPQTKNRRTLTMAAAGALVLAGIAGITVMLSGDGAKKHGPDQAALQGAASGDASSVVPAAAIKVDAAERLVPASDMDASVADEPEQERPHAAVGSAPKPATKKLPASTLAAVKDAEPMPGKAPTSNADAAPPTSNALTQLYVSVGEAIQKLQTTQPELVASFNKQYSEIPFNDALRVPAMRKDVEAKLQRIYAEIRKVPSP